MKKRKNKRTQNQIQKLYKQAQRACKVLEAEPSSPAVATSTQKELPNV